MTVEQAMELVAETGKTFGMGMIAGAIVSAVGTATFMVVLYGLYDFTKLWLELRADKKLAAKEAQDASDEGKKV